MKLIRFFNPSSVIYMRAQVTSGTPVNVCWLIQTFKYQYWGFQVYFKSILVYNLKTKSDFWSKCPHYIICYIINWVSIFFIFSYVLNLAYIDYSLCQIWRAYMQYSRCCDHSNECVFLVCQQAEVLLNFFGECMCNKHISRSQWWKYAIRSGQRILNLTGASFLLT